MKQIIIVATSFLFLLISSPLFAVEKDTIIFPPIPKKIETNVERITELICQVAKNDVEKAYFIFYWISHNIKWDVNTFNKTTKIKKRKVSDILKQKRGYPHDFAELYKEMCEHMGIRTHVINGYERNILYEEGTSFYTPNHTWNAILVDYKWQFVDVFSAAGQNYMDLNAFKKLFQQINKKKLYTSTKMKFYFEFNPKFFLQHPEELRVTRLPADPIWQLTDTMMSLSVFEEGEEAVKVFNERFSAPQQDYVKLSEVNNMTIEDEIVESADRIYAFNPRNTLMKSNKHKALAIKEYNKITLVKTKQEAKLIVQKSKGELTTSKEILNKEQQQITKEHADLRKVNLEKKTDVFKFKQSFTSINNKYITESKSKLSNAETKTKSLKSDVINKAKKINDVNKANFAKVKSINPEQPTTSIQYKKLSDSIVTRNTSINQLANQILNKKTRIAELKAEQEKCSDNLVYYIRKSDSSLNKEAIARSKKQDSYSDSIKMIRSDLNQYKAIMADSLQQNYFDLYDSITQNYEEAKKEFVQIYETSKSNVKDIEAIAKLNKSDLTLSSQHEENVDRYTENLRGYINHSISYINYLKTQKDLITGLKKIYEYENKFFNNLGRKEEDRKEFLKKLIDKREKFVKKQNEQRKEEITELKKKIDQNLKNMDKKITKKSTKKNVLLK